MSVRRMAALTWSGKALVAALLSRMFFGGYLAGMDQYRFDDVESALTVVLIYLLLGVFTVLFVSGRRYGIAGVIGLSVIVVVLQSFYIVLSYYSVTNAGPHDPLENSWAALLRYLFSFLTLIFAIKVKEDSKLRGDNQNSHTMLIRTAESSSTSGSSTDPLSLYHTLKRTWIGPRTAVSVMRHGAPFCK